jgi:hypothetical protein
MTDPNKQMGVIKKNRTLLLYENRNRQHNTELKTRKHVNVQRRVCWQHAYRPCLLAILWTKLFQKRMVCNISNIDLRYHYYYRVTIPLLVDYKGIIYPVINVSALIWLMRYIVSLRHYMFLLLPVSLDCPFWLPLRYSLMFIYHGLEISNS